MIGAIYIDQPALPLGVNGDTAAQVGQDQIGLLVLPAQVPGSQAGYPPDIEGVAQAAPFYFLKAGEAGDIFHFIHRNGIDNKGRNAVLLADGMGKESPQVSRVFTLYTRPEIGQHFFVY